MKVPRNVHIAGFILLPALCASFSGLISCSKSNDYSPVGSPGGTLITL